jgi:two-component system chemotaxis response regulator CheY
MKTILIVDDDKMVREIISYKLTKCGYNVISAHHGRDALEKIDGVDVDIVVTDIMMPVMDGFELIENLRRKFEQKTIPIIILSARSRNFFDKVRTRHLEIVEWIEKPFMLRDLISTVRNY